MMPGDQVGKYAPGGTQLLLRPVGTGGGMGDPVRAALKVSALGVEAGCSADVALEGRTIFAKVVPASRQVRPGLGAEWLGEGPGQCGDGSQVVVQSMQAPDAVGSLHGVGDGGFAGFVHLASRGFDRDIGRLPMVLEGKDSRVVTQNVSPRFGNRKKKLTGGAQSLGGCELDSRQGCVRGIAAPGCELLVVFPAAAPRRAPRGVSGCGGVRP